MGSHTTSAVDLVAASAPAEVGSPRAGLPQRLRILIHGLNFWPDLTGVAKYTAEMAEWLAARGHEVRVVTAPPHYPDWKIPEGYGRYWYTRDRLDGVEILRCPFRMPKKSTGFERILQAASFGASSWIPMMKRAAGWRPDLVWTVAPSIISASAALMAARVAGAPAWLHIQDLEADAAFALGFLGGDRLRAAALGFETRLIRQFDRVSTISDAMSRRLLEKGCDPFRLTLVPNWVDVEEIRPLDGPDRFRAELGIAAGGVVALYAGSMGRKQGLPLILQAAEKLASLENLHFLLAGGGPERDGLERAAASMKNVHILPLQPSERFPELLSAADIHLLPQMADAADLVLPSKLMGMMASARPVVATAEPHTDLAREVEPNGLVTPPGDADGFAAAIAALAADPAERSRLGRTGRQRAARQWDRKWVLGRLETEFVDLAERGSAAAATPVGA